MPPRSRSRRGNPRGCGAPRRASPSRRRASGVRSPGATRSRSCGRSPTSTSRGPRASSSPTTGGSLRRAATTPRVRAPTSASLIRRPAHPHARSPTGWRSRSSSRASRSSPAAGGSRPHTWITSRLSTTATSTSCGTTPSRGRVGAWRGARTASPSSPRTAASGSCTSTLRTLSSSRRSRRLAGASASPVSTSSKWLTTSSAGGPRCWAT
mmetsp:Transcript_24497/g.69826  ORF Transcript_24497/g.69826 Transcript_24497/m.69826 type:complete len:210 (+) Transcript_24497:57-686(+)